MIAPSVPKCALCGGRLTWIVDLGPQPLCNRFPTSATDPEFQYVLSVAVCPSCGLVQIPEPPGAEELRPRVDWIAYAEPEGHLDDVARSIAQLPSLDRSARIRGVGDYDEPLLQRLRSLGFGDASSIDWRLELDVRKPHARTETLQGALTLTSARAIAERHGRADVLVARSLLEHAHSVCDLLAALRELLASGGHLVVEVPDCVTPLESGDPSALWEEHVLYFTPVSLEACLVANGFRLVSLGRQRGTNEMVGIAQARHGSGAPGPSPGDVTAEVQRAKTFARRLTEAGARWRSLLRANASAGRTVALFGAGHVAIMFVNAFGLGDSIACVVDDHPHKQGLLLPGSQLPIVPSSALPDERIDVCLMTVSPEAERRVLESMQDWIGAGGEVLSILPQSERYALTASLLA